MVRKKTRILLISISVIGLMLLTFSIAFHWGQLTPTSAEKTVVRSSMTNTPQLAKVGLTTQENESSVDEPDNFETVSKPETPKRHPDTEWKSEARQDLEQSLLGNIDDAIEYYGKFNSCQNSEKLLLFVDKQSSNLETANKKAGIDFDIGSSEDALTNADDKYQECQQYFGKSDTDKGLSTEGLLDYTGREAQKGNTFARFLYAMWTPTDDISFYMGDEFIRDFEEQAKEFTSYNKNDDPKLWLLAMGLSYSTGLNFTPLRHSMGSTYLLAAQMCGISHPIVTKQLSANTILRQMMGTEGYSISNFQLSERAQILAAENCF